MNKQELVKQYLARDKELLSLVKDDLDAPGKIRLIRTLEARIKIHKAFINLNQWEER